MQAGSLAMPPPDSQLSVRRLLGKGPRGGGGGAVMRSWACQQYNFVRLTYQAAPEPLHPCASFLLVLIRMYPWGHVLCSCGPSMPWKSPNLQEDRQGPRVDIAKHPPVQLQ